MRLICLYFAIIIIYITACQNFGVLLYFHTFDTIINMNLIIIIYWKCKWWWEIIVCTWVHIMHVFICGWYDERTNYYSLYINELNRYLECNKKIVQNNIIKNYIILYYITRNNFW